MLAVVGAVLISGGIVLLPALKHFGEMTPPPRLMRFPMALEILIVLFIAMVVVGGAMEISYAAAIPKAGWSLGSVLLAMGIVAFAIISAVVFVPAHGPENAAPADPAAVSPRAAGAVMGPEHRPPSRSGASGPRRRRRAA